MFIPFFGWGGLLSALTGFRWSNPYISAKTVVSTYEPIATMSDGYLGILSRKFNWGLEAGNTFYWKHHLFVRAGIKYFKNAQTLHLIPRENNDVLFQHSVGFRRYYHSYMISLLLGKSWEFKGGNTLDAYIGMGNGMLSLSKIKSGNSIVNQLSQPSSNIEQGINDYNEKATPNYYMMTLDFGFNIQPVKSWQNVTVGLFAELQLNAIEHNTQYKSYSKDLILNRQYDLKLNYAIGRINNMGLKFNYSF